ncbi:MAG: HAMP domain-containing histidine kinase [Bacteroidales bacterium]|nr:HAMP domain-containing histidine kinase [Bacteroidales bacterium]
MKKRRIFFVLFGMIALIATVITLSINVYHLYVEAEKAQKTAFTGNILTVGREIVQHINSELSRTDRKQSDDDNDSAHTRNKQTFLFDKQPVALINETTIDYNGNTIVLHKDTTFLSNPNDTLSSDSLLSIPVLSATDSAELQAFSDLILDNIDQDSLRGFIHNILFMNKLPIDFDFCIYNVPENKFVIPPKVNYRELLNKGYVFALTKEKERSTSHYFVLFFPSERAYFMRNMKNILFPIIVILLLITFLIALLILSLSQQKINEDVKNDFINNITHEFKTPISTISLACSAMEDPVIRENVPMMMDYVSIVQTENNRLKKMVDNILQLARLKRGQLQLRQEKIDVHSLLRSIADNISLQVTSKNGNLTTHLDAQIATIIGDPTHIESVLVNLIENALKYSPEKPEITISTWNEKKYLIVSIKDNGIGIPKQSLRHVFDEFYRVPKGNIHDVKGYGIGLHYVKKIIQKHSGKIKVESELNHGSTFLLYLPLK